MSERRKRSVRTTTPIGLVLALVLLFLAGFTAAYFRYRECRAQGFTILHCVTR